MNRKLIRAVIFGSVALLAFGGCSTKRQPQAAIPVSSAAGIRSLPGASATGGSETPAALPDEERLDYERVVVPPLRPAEEMQEPEPEKGTEQQAPTRNTPSRTPRPSAGSPGRPAESDAVVEPETPRAPDVRTPALRPMISDTDRRQLEGQIQGNLDRFRKNIGLIRASRLGANERNALEEARSFAARAEQLKGSDPLLANSLAERAAILTQEILRKQ